MYTLKAIKSVVYETEAYVLTDDEAEEIKKQIREGAKLIEVKKGKLWIPDHNISTLMQDEPHARNN